MAATEQSETMSLRLVQGDIKNNLRLPLSLLRSHDWSGHVVDKYPENINPKDCVHFEHDGTESGPDGSKAMVIYSTPVPSLVPNPDVPHVETPCFLVAWWRSVRYAKVYVQFGPKKELENINLCEIEDELNKAGEESSIPASIYFIGASAKIGYDGKLEVNFG